MLVALVVARAMYGPNDSPSPPSALLADPGVAGVQAIYAYQMTLYDHISHHGELADEHYVRALYDLMPPSCARRYGSDGYGYFTDQLKNGDWWEAMGLAAAVRSVGVAPEPKQISIDSRYHDATVAPPGRDPANIDSLNSENPKAIGGGWGSWSRYIYINGRWYDDRPSICPDPLN
ncbi:MAG: hypothetical protein M3P30_04760 [Chloroflexota bacterium]|nr:hypothetical protein [Chloroflexota bacterium]